MTKIMYSLNCSFDSSSFFRQDWVSEGEKRNLQYVKGLKSYFKLHKENVDSCEDVYIIDNTVLNKSKVDKTILEVIPEEVNLIFTHKNNYGKLNKGAGLIEGWEHNKELIKQYDFIFHHEPRQELINFNFYKTFISNPKNLFLALHNTQFWTGTMILKSKHLLEYIENSPVEKLGPYGISIESDMYNFFKDKEIPFNTVEKLGIEWHDESKKVKRIY